MQQCLYRNVIVLASLATATTFVSAQQPKLLVTLEGRTEHVMSMAFSPDGKSLASGVREVRLWDVATGRHKKTLPAEDAYHCIPTFSPDGKTLAVGSAGNRIETFDLETGKQRLLRKGSGHPFASPTIVFSSDGKRIAAGGNCGDSNIVLFDVAKGKQLVSLEGDDPYGFRAIAFLPDGKSLASVGVDGALRHWDTANGNNTDTFQLTDETDAAAFSPDLKTVAIATVTRSDAGLRTSYSTQIHDVATGRKLTSLEKHSEFIHAFAFSPNGKMLASADGNGIVKIWDTATWKEKARWKPHRENAWALAFSPNSTILASGEGRDGSVDDDFSIKLWDVADISKK
jgi:WD40 repeat protein